MEITNSINTTLAPPQPKMILIATGLSPSLTTQLKPSAGLKTIVSLKPVPQWLAPLTMPVIAMLVPQGQENLTTLGSPAHGTILSGSPSQPNAHLLALTAQQALAVPTINMLPPEQGKLTTTGNIPPETYNYLDRRQSC